jgi:hypothetical protein
MRPRRWTSRPTPDANSALARPGAAEHPSIVPLRLRQAVDQVYMRNIALRALGAVVAAAYLVVYLAIALAARTALDITPR